MGEYGVEQLLVGEPRILEPELGVWCPLLTEKLSNRDPHCSHELAKFSFEGGVLRYSMTTGSMPAWRISASVLREVPHAGL